MSDVMDSFLRHHVCYASGVSTRFIMEHWLYWVSVSMDETIYAAYLYAFLMAVYDVE